MGWLGDGSHRRQSHQAWTAVGLPPRYPQTVEFCQQQQTTNVRSVTRHNIYDPSLLLLLTTSHHSYTPLIPTFCRNLQHSATLSKNMMWRHDMLSYGYRWFSVDFFRFWPKMRFHSIFGRKLNSHTFGGILLSPTSSRYRKCTTCSLYQTARRSRLFITQIRTAITQCNLIPW